jgi:2-oxoglutarate ferredoxin oxidoreductase subunit beta
MWCTGCGNGAVMSAFLGAVDDARLDMKMIAVVSGIGCSGRIGGYIKADSIHVAHGRSLPVALGAKLTRPDLTVVAFMGDGDAYSIGGNHLLHAARRDDDVKAIVINNMVFGMTGGQQSPTTPASMIESPLLAQGPKPLDGPILCAVTGASYAARWPTSDFMELRNSVKTALTTPGFCLVEALSQCPVQFGKLVTRDPSRLMKWIKDRTIRVDDAVRGRTTNGKMLVGEFTKAGKGLRPELEGLIRG